MNTILSPIIGQTFGYHHDMDTEAWIIMGLGMLVFWAAIIALVVWLVRGGFTTSRYEPPHEVLRRRLADGSISIDEYERRRAALETTATETETEGEPPPTTPSKPA